MYDSQRDASDSQHFADRSDLTVIEADIWSLLLQAVTDRECGWRLPSFATRCAAGVRQRTVVLRAVDADRRRLLVHTDARSPKVDQIADDNRVSMLFYDRSRGVQLSVTATATVHTDDDTADGLWQASHPLSLKYVLGPMAPGTVCDEPSINLPPGWLDRVPTADDLAAVRDRFATVSFQVLAIDWLSLSRAGNLRAEFDYTADPPDPVRRRWLAP